MTKTQVFPGSRTGLSAVISDPEAGIKTQLIPGVGAVQSLPSLSSNLSLTGFDTGDAFGGATLAPGAVQLAPAGFADADSFGSLQLRLKLQLGGFASGSAFGALALAPGAVTLALSGFQEADVVGPLALSVGSVSIALAGFSGATGFGSPSLSAGTVDLVLGGIAAGGGFGALALCQTVTLSGFAGVNHFGALTVTAEPAQLALAGIAAQDRFGAAALAVGPVTLTLHGFLDPERYGVPVLQLKKKNGQGGGTKPGGVGAAQKYATRITMSEAGLIVALEAQSSVAKNVNTRMALYADNGGLPGALIAQSAVRASVVIGSNSYPLLASHAVLGGAAVWAALHSDGNFNWFLSAGPTSRFNADAFADGPSDPFGSSTLSNNKAPVFVVYLDAVTLELKATGVADGDLFGGAKLVPVLPQDIAAVGFADPDRFGMPELRPASATIALSGFAEADRFGAGELRGASALQVAGIANDNEFGSMALDREAALAGSAELTLRNRRRRERVFDNAIDGSRRLLVNRR